MKNNKLNRNVNKVITIGMAGAVALSAPLSFVYASPDADEQHEYTDIHGVCDICGETKEDGNHFVDEIIDDGIIEIDPNDTENDKKDDDVIIVDTCDEDHIEYPFVDLDNDGFCDNCGAEKKENTENTESTETTEEPNEKVYKDFSFFIKGYNTASDKDITNIYNKLKTDGKYKLSYVDNKTEKDLKVKVNIYNNDKELIDNFILSNSDKIIKNLPDKDKEGYEQFSCNYELIAENLHYTKDGKCFMYSSIITEDGEIPVLKFFRLVKCTNCGNSESPIHIDKEYGVVCDYNNPDFDLDLFLENEEIKDFFSVSGVIDKDCVCAGGIPDLPPLPEIPDTSESTETSETTEEKPSTETSEEKPSTETSETTEEKPSTETSEEKPSTETSETTEEKPSTETSEEKPSTETSETTEEKPSTETSEEKPSTETSETTEEKPSTETTTTPTPEPVKPVEPTPTTETTTTTTTITEDRGKVDPSETVKNEMVQTGDIATNTYYGGYFLATAFGVLTAFFKKFKK